MSNNTKITFFFLVHFTLPEVFLCCNPWLAFSIGWKEILPVKVEKGTPKIKIKIIHV